MSTQKKYRHIFFDLDNTLWDFNHNSVETLREIFIEWIAPRSSLGVENFIEVYEKINHDLWNKYRDGQISRQQVAIDRFTLTLRHFGIDDERLAAILSEAYIHRSPRKTRLVEGASEVLVQLKSKFHLHIITNGFLEVQIPKVEHSGLNEYFETITTSEECGCLKPCRKIFEFALRKAGARPKESLMIGDDSDGDVKGAKEAGMDAIFYNISDEKNPPEALYCIKDLRELLPLLMS